jgi:hypothetical protein
MAVSTRARISRRPLPKPPPPLRKGMATARRLSVFERKVEIGLSPTTLELVVDLAALAGKLSDDPDAATARRFADLAPDDARVRARARRIAFDEARRLAGGTLIQPEIDLEVRARGPVVQFALNVEALLRRR